MIKSEYILICLCEELSELLEETFNSNDISNVDNLKSNENFIKELADVLALSKMFYDEHCKYLEQDFGEFVTYNAINFKNMASHNTWLEEDNLQLVLLSAQKYIYKALRFGLDNVYLNNKSNKDMILDCIQKILSFSKYKLSLNGAVSSSIEDMIKVKIAKVKEFMTISEIARTLIDEKDIFDVQKFGLTSNPTHYTFASDCPICNGKDENCTHFYNLQTLELKFKSFKSSLTKRFKNIEKFQEVLRNCYIPLDDILKENFKKNNISIDFSKYASNNIIKYKDGYIARPFIVTSKKDDKVVYKAPHFIKYKESDTCLKGDLYFGLSLQEYESRLLKKDEKFLEDNKLTYAVYEYNDYYFKSYSISSVLDRLGSNAYEVGQNIKTYRPDEIGEDCIDEDLISNDDE